MVFINHKIKNLILNNILLESLMLCRTLYLVFYLFKVAIYAIIYAALKKSTFYDIKYISCLSCSDDSSISSTCKMHK